MRTNTRRVSVCVAAAAAATQLIMSASVSADTVWWQGGTGNLLDPNYYDLTLNTANVTPTAADVVDFGAGGIGTYNTGTEVSLLKLRVGHNDAATVPPAPISYTGQGTLTVSGTGTKISLTGGASGIANAALWIGNAQNATLNIQDNANITSNRLVAVGVGNNTGRAGTLNILTGGSLTVSDGNLTLGDRSGSSGAGVKGNLTISDDASSITVAGGGADLNIGPRTATCSYTQTGGTVSVNDVVEVGMASGDNANSSLTLSGGTLTHGGNFFVGRGTTTGATVNLSETGTINTGGRFLIGGQTATGIVVNQSGGTLNTTLDVRVGDAGTGDATYNLSGTGIINSTTGGHIGRSGTAVFNQTGGQANFNGLLNIGNRENATNPNSGLYKISGGELHINATGNALSLAANGVGEFRVIGDGGLIDVNGNFAASNGINGTSTLSYSFETGELLSVVDVSGAATFANGSNVVLDTTNAAPTETSYHLLAAADITDAGLVFSGPAGWTADIIGGGDGEILRATSVPVAAALYWDIDGASPGAGGAAPSGTWDGAAANFTADAAGASAATVGITSSASDVLFAAGTDAGDAYTVTLTGRQVVKSLGVDRGSVTFTGGTIATPTVNVASGAAATVNSGVATTTGLTKTGVGALTLAAANTYTGGTTVSAGTLVLGNADATAGGSINVADGATVLAQAGLAKAITVSTLATNASGRFDLADNSMVIKGMTSDQVRGLIQAAFNAGHWNGATGLDSSTAAANVSGTTAIGYAVAGFLGKSEFKGVSPLAGTDVLVKYTYYGDNDLSGATNLDDFTLFLNGYQNGGTTWVKGDYDYSGGVTLNDFSLFLKGYQQQGASLSALESLINTVPMSDTERAGMLAAVQAVPEPGSAALLGVAGIGLLANRRRRRKPSAA
jgi:autotransporter-associated beta strand protein